MPVSYDLSPETVIKMVQNNQATLKAPPEYGRTENSTKVGGMSFKQYSQTIGQHSTLNPKYESEFDKLLTKHRVPKGPSHFDAKVERRAFARRYGEFSHEVERMINDGLLKRK